MIALQRGHFSNFEGTSAETRGACGRCIWLGCRLFHVYKEGTEACSYIFSSSVDNCITQQEAFTDDAKDKLERDKKNRIKSIITDVDSSHQNGHSVSWKNIHLLCVLLDYNTCVALNQAKGLFSVF